MNPELAHRAEDIFYDLLGVDPAQREPALREACGGDSSLLSEVRSLLRAHREPAAFMDTARARELASQAQAAPLSNGATRNRMFFIDLGGARRVSLPPFEGPPCRPTPT